MYIYIHTYDIYGQMLVKLIQVSIGMIHVSFATRVSVYYTNSSVRVRNIIASTVLRPNQVCTNL